MLQQRKRLGGGKFRVHPVDGQVCWQRHRPAVVYVYHAASCVIGDDGETVGLVLLGSSRQLLKPAKNRGELSAAWTK